MKALLIGGTGTISMAITRLLLEKGWQVHLLNRGSRRAEVPQGVHWIQADISDEAAVREILEGRHFADGVCKNAYCIDIHDPKGKGWNARQITSPEKCYDIPYRCLVPAQTDGLLVAGRCISATHEALGSIRIMAPCMGTGQAAGTAAAMAVSEKKDVRDIDTAALRAALQKADVLL